MDNSKTCTKCKEGKDRSLFSFNRRSKDGYNYICKKCISLNALQWQAKNKERSYNNIKKWNKTDKGRAAGNFYSAKRKIAKEKRTPSWLSEDDWWMIEQAYKLAVLREQMTGIKWHVDHVVPLRGKTVSGLHVPWNLQVIPATDNIKKGNKYDQA